MSMQDESQISILEVWGAELHTDVVGAAAGALVTDGGRRRLAVGGVPNLDLLLV